MTEKMTRVMIIENKSEIIREMKIHLEYLYCDVISVVDSGEEAVEYLRAEQSRQTVSDTDAVMPDVIFLDIGLNRSDLSRNSISLKYDAAATAKHIRKEWNIPIIFIVGHTDDDLLSTVKLDFPFGYVLTPLSTRELKATIDVAIYTFKIEAERNSAKKELIQSDERYRALVDNMVSGVAIYEVVGDGEDFIFVDLNKGAEKIEQQKREELIGRSIFEARPGVREFGLIDTFKKVIKTGKPHIHHLSLYKDDRVSRYYENYVYQLSSGEIVALFRDETIKKIAEDEMKKLQEQLNHSQKMEALGIMAGGIAHDFNNILFPIIGSAEMLIEDSVEGTTQRMLLKEILKSGYRAKELVKQILTFSRQEQQGGFMPLSLEPIVKEIIKLSRSMLPSTIRINQNISKNCCMVMADPTQIHQVFMNLIINAFHAMEDSGGVLTIRLQAVENPQVLQLPLGKYISIEVIDTGVGIDEATQKRIFEPYFTTKEIGKGTGLGLSIVHGIVKRYKGEIVVKSEIGKGTAFTIYLPGVEQEPVNVIEEKSPSKDRGSETIMVVDDEPVVAKMLCIILEKAGYKVFPKTSSIDALESFREKPDMYDLVITDLTMPDLTGEKLCAQLKMAAPAIPVILCTGFSAKVPALETGNFGIDKIIMKPILSSDLLKKVRELLD